MFQVIKFTPTKYFGLAAAGEPLAKSRWTTHLLAKTVMMFCRESFLSVLFHFCYRESHRTAFQLNGLLCNNVSSKETHYQVRHRIASQTGQISSLWSAHQIPSVLPICLVWTNFIWHQWPLAFPSGWGKCICTLFKSFMDYTCNGQFQGIEGSV